MNFHRKFSRQNDLEVNLIPLIDVLLVIVIFLAATTSFTHVSQLKVTLPQAQAGAPADSAVINVAISQEGLYALDGKLISGQDADDIASALRDAVKAGKSATVVINADALSSHESVVRVMEAARLAGIRRVNFAIRSPH